MPGSTTGDPKEEGAKQEDPLPEEQANQADEPVPEGETKEVAEDPVPEEQGNQGESTLVEDEVKQEDPVPEEPVQPAAEQSDVLSLPKSPEEDEFQVPEDAASVQDSEDLGGSSSSESEDMGTIYEREVKKKKKVKPNWVANILIEGGSNLNVGGCCGSGTTFLVARLVTDKGSEKRVTKRFTQLPPSKNENSWRSKAQQVDIENWMGPNPNWRARFQLPLENYRDTKLHNPIIAVEVHERRSLVDVKIGEYIIPVAPRYTDLSTVHPGEVSETGFLRPGDDGWGDCMHEAEEINAPLGSGKINIRRVYFKPLLKKLPKEIPELWRGTKVLPNMHMWGLSLKGTGDLRSDNYMLEKGDDFDLSTMTGKVTKVRNRNLTVQVQWDGDSEKRWYRSGLDGIHDVLPVSHKAGSGDTAEHLYVTEWNPMDLFSPKQIRHMLFVLRQMNQLVIQGITNLRATRTKDTEQRKQEFHDLIQKALLPLPGWLSLYSLFSVLVENYDNLTRSESQSFRQSWDNEAPTLKREIIAGLFHPRFPARDRYNLLLTCKIIDEDINESTEPVEATTVDVEGEESIAAPLTRADSQAWEELKRWRDTNRYTEAGLAYIKGVVHTWTKSNNTRNVKDALDRLIPKLVARLQPQDEVGRSAVLNDVFMNCVLKDAATFMYKAEKDLQSRTGVPTTKTVQEMQEQSSNEMQKLLAPFGSSTDQGTGPKHMLELCRALEEVSLLQTSEAIESAVGWKPRQSGDKFVKDMKTMTRRHKKKLVNEKTSCCTSAWSTVKPYLKSPMRRSCDYMEGRLGSAIGEYFRFVKFIVHINLLCFFIWAYFVVAPWVDWVSNDVVNNGTANDVDVDFAKAFGNMIGVLGHTEYNATNVTHPFSIAREEGDWFLYGAYPTRLDINYRIGAAYTAACFLTLIATFLFIAVEIGKRVKQEPSGLSKTNNRELFKAKWKRILGREIMFSKSRLSLVDQRIDSADISLDPISLEQIEDSAMMQVMEEENAINLLSWPIGLSDAEGTKLKLESSRQFWELQHALIGYQEAELEHDGACCSEMRVRQYKTYVGWWLSVCIFVESFILLFLILDNREKLNTDYNEWVAPILIAAVNSGTPVILKKIVQILEYYEDNRLTVYHIIIRQFCCKMSNMVWVILQSINTTNVPGQRCTVNDTATLIYQLVATGLALEVILFFASGLGLMLFGRVVVYPMAVKSIFMKTMNLKTPKKFRPSSEAALSFTDGKVTIDDDLTEENRSMYVKVSNVIDLYEEPKEAALKLDQAKEVLLDKQNSNDHENEKAAFKQVRKLQQEAVNIKKIALTKSLQEKNLDSEMCMQTKLHAERDIIFQTYMFTMEDYKKSYDMIKLLRLLRKMNKHIPADVAMTTAECLPLDELMCPIKPGAVGYHVPRDTKPKWTTVPDLVLLDQFGELKDVVRNQLLTDVEKKKIKQLDENLIEKVSTVITIQNAYCKTVKEQGRTTMKQGGEVDEEDLEAFHLRKQDAELHICEHRRELYDMLRLRVYLKQKKDYTQKVNRLLKDLNDARENMPPANGKSEFELPQQVMSFLYLQSLVWVGSVFSPMMMVQGFLATLIWFISQRYFVDWFHVGSKRPIAIGSSSVFFYYLMGVVLFVAMIPIAAFMDTTMDCGPHSGTTPIHGFWEWAGDWPDPLDKITAWFFSPFVLVSIICLQVGVQILGYMKYFGLSRDVESAYKELAEQKAEGKETAAYMLRYTQDIQNFHRSQLLLEPNLMLDTTSDVFVGGKGSVNLSYTNTFETTMCGLLKRSPLDQLEQKVLQGDNAHVLKSVKAAKNNAPMMVSSIWVNK